VRLLELRKPLLTSNPHLPIQAEKAKNNAPILM